MGFILFNTIINIMFDQSWGFLIRIISGIPMIDRDNI